MRLVGTTKPTILSIRERTHWNSPNLVAQDPVTLGLCSQIDLDAAVKRAAARLERERKKAEKAAAKAGTLLPTEETTAAAVPMTPAEAHAGAASPPEAPLVPPAPPTPEDAMAASLAKEARDAMAAPVEEEAAPDADSVFAKLKELKPEGGGSEEDTPSE